MSPTPRSSGRRRGLGQHSDVDRACRSRAGAEDPARPARRPGASAAFPRSEVPTTSPPRPRPAPEPGHLLPLLPRPRRLAVIGPNADDLASLLGDYVPPLADGIGATILDGYSRSDEESGTKSDRASPRRSPAASPRRAVAEAETWWCSCSARPAVAATTTTSRRTAPRHSTARRPSATSGEGFDVAEVELPPPSATWSTAVAARGTPTVAVVVSGRPLGIGHVARRLRRRALRLVPGPRGRQCHRGRHPGRPRTSRSTACLPPPVLAASFPSRTTSGSRRPSATSTPRAAHCCPSGPAKGGQRGTWGHRPCRTDRQDLPSTRP